MKLVIVEENNGESGAELTFEKNLVTIGRDPMNCDQVFDQTKWPMVSRTHAEFRMMGDRLVVDDLRSRYGTLVDGRAIVAKEPCEMREGMRVQFGANGPTIRLVRYESTPD